MLWTDSWHAEVLASYWLWERRPRRLSTQADEDVGVPKADADLRERAALKIRLTT